MNPNAPDRIIDGFRIGARLHAGGMGTIHAVSYAQGAPDPGFPMIMKLPRIGSDGAGAIAADPRQLHDHREAGIGRALRITHGMDRAHAAGMQACADAEAVDDAVGRVRVHRPSASRRAAWSSAPARSMARIAASMS